MSDQVAVNALCSLVSILGLLAIASLVRRGRRIDRAREPDDEPETSAFLSLVRHDHGEPGGYAVVLERPIVHLDIDSDPPGLLPGIGALVTVRAALLDGEHSAMLMLDAVQARELAEALLEEADRVLAPAEGGA